MCPPPERLRPDTSPSTRMSANRLSIATRAARSRSETSQIFGSEGAAEGGGGGRVGCPSRGSAEGGPPLADSGVETVRAATGAAGTVSRDSNES
jgi:hypothetical protein